MSDATMATNQHDSLREELQQYNDRLDRALRSRYRMSFRTFKIIKALAQLAGVCASIYAMSLGAPPLASLVMATIILTGAEGIEVLIENQGEA